MDKSHNFKVSEGPEIYKSDPGRAPNLPVTPRTWVHGPLGLRLLDLPVTGIVINNNNKTDFF